MSKQTFPYVALGLGLILMLVVITGSEIRADGATTIPLFTLLAISEFGFFVTAFGAFFGIKQIVSVGATTGYAAIAGACVILSILFLLRGVALWPL